MAKLSNNSSTTGTTQRKSYLLSVTPVEYSLTEGTNIPAPERSPTRSPAPQDMAPPPTPGRGPLNSHPATPDDASEMALDRTTTRETEANHNTARVMSSDGASSTTTHPTSPPQHSSPQARRPSGVRKLLSLSNLRSSFSSSRTSLAIPRSSNDTYGSSGTHPQQHSTPPYNPSLKRPSSPSMASTMASSVHTQNQNQSQPPNTQLRPKKSGGNWFKRKSGLFMLNGNGAELDAVAEDNTYRPETRESKRVKGSAGGETVVHRVPEGRQATPPPMIGELGGGKGFSGGDLGWDESAFRR